MIIVTGHAKLKDGAVARLADAMQAAIAATREEDGCIAYTYGVDVTAPDTLLILEYWRDLDALKAHGRADHMQTWAAAFGQEIVEFDVKVGDADAMKPLRP